MNVMKMMKQAQELQAKAQKMQSELAAKQYEGGSGPVKAITNGDSQLISLKIDPSVIKEGNAEMLEDLIVAAVREALEKGKNEAQKEMGKLTAGMGLPI